MATVGSSTSSLSSLSAKTGIGGLVSGMDLDELVTNLTATSRAKILKQQQHVQRLEWKQTGYRSVSAALKEFQSKYLDVLSATNFRSSTLFNTVKATSSSEAVSVISTSGASAGTVTINSVTQLATAQTIKSGSAVSRGLTGSLSGSGENGALTTGDIEALAAQLDGKSISLNLNGTTKAITFNFSAPSTAEELQNQIQTVIDNAFGTYNDPVHGSKSMIEAGIDQSTGTLSLFASGSRLTVYAVGDDTDTLDHLGLSSGQSNKITTANTIESLSLIADTDPEGDGSYEFKINGVEFSFTSTDTLSSVINRINSSKAGVTVSYSAITDRFTMTSKVSGSGENIVIEESQGKLLEALGLHGEGNADVEYGVNAILQVNGQDIVRSSNTINIDGLTIELNSKPSEAVTITMKSDVSGLMDTVKKFVEDYNSMVDLMNSLIKEKVYKDYAPLSEEQRNEMSENQIKNWEEKAKSGILRGDRIIGDITSKMHTLMTGFSVSGFSLYSMGITSAGYTENGKLKITDEDALRTALETKGTEVAQLFTSEKGLSSQLNSIINDAIRTSGVQGTRGTLVEAAGIASTRSDVENSITKAMERANKTIAVLQSRLSSEESRLWSRFTAMETALQQLNTQSAMLTQFSSNGN